MIVQSSNDKNDINLNFKMHFTIDFFNFQRTQQVALKSQLILIP